MKNTLPTNHNSTVVLRHLHVVALLQNPKERWNAETITKFLCERITPDGSLESKTIRKDIKKHINETLGIQIPTKQGARSIKFDTPLSKEVLRNLLMLYSNFIVHDTSRIIALDKLVKNQGELSLWLLARIHFAILAKTKIRFTYTTNEMMIREATINPYSLVIRDNTLYLIGKREKDNSVGPYIFERIDNLKILEQTFEEDIPSSETFFANSHSAFFCDWADPVEIRIKYNPKRENNMLSEFSHLNPEIKRFKDHHEMKFNVLDYESVCRQLFFYGSDVEILSPADAIEHMKEKLQEALSVYKKNEVSE